MLRIFQTELYECITETLVETVGDVGAWTGIDPASAVNASALWIHLLHTTMDGGGTLEV